MKPFRDAMEELGFTDVESYATSGNILFNARASDSASLERRIAGRFNTAAFVRTRMEMAQVVNQDRLGAMVMFLAHPPAAAKKPASLDLDFKEPPGSPRKNALLLVSTPCAREAHAVRYRARVRRQRNVPYCARGGAATRSHVGSIEGISMKKKPNRETATA
jgi:hypothetical protein